MNYDVVESHTDTFVAHALQDCKSYRHNRAVRSVMQAKKGEGAEDHLAFKGRIRAAMTRKGWPTSRDGRDIAVVVLRTKWREYFKERKAIRTPSRPTFYDWLAHQEAKISPKNLFLLSDVLDVSARWLGLNEGPVQKPFFQEDEIQILLDAWPHLNDAARDELRKEVQKLLRIQGVRGPVNPFPIKSR